MLFYACSNDISMILPRGPEGPQGPQGPTGASGKSAYEVWVEAVGSGIIEWDENTDMSGFFRYLKGKDGVDGINGHDGIDGMDGIDGNSAYELWLEAVESGIDDPHNPGRQWNKNATSIADFFWFLSGNDGVDGINGSNGNDGPSGTSGTSGTSGLSAYQIWVGDVQDENGLVNPHDPDGGLWPCDCVSISDFWEYLHGENGGESQIYVPIQDPGSAGNEATLVTGKANVISQYQVKDHSEYVSVTDGSVTFHVYNDAGAPASGAKVKGLPGMDPALVFTADGDGVFKVERLQLPTTGSNELRYGAVTEVEYTNSKGELKTEASAPNTYVPQKIDVRLRICGNIVTNNNVENDHIEGAVAMGVPIAVERRVSDTSDWEVIPNWLGSLTQTFKVYELNDHEDPASYTPGTTYWNSSQSLITYASSLKRVERPTRRWPAMDADSQREIYRYREESIYVNIVMESYYGESPHANAVIDVAPVQFHPLPVISTPAYTAAGDGLDGIKGTFDLSGVDDAYLYDTNLASMAKTTVGGTAFTYYYPVVTTPKATIYNVKSFSIIFKKSVTGGESVFTTTSVTLGSPGYSLGNTILAGSYVYLKPSGRFFVGPGTKEPIGVVKGNATDGFHIEAIGPKFVFPDIDITLEP
uniref:Uncharacterized protein n=2 Tax=termite gut metagenome TaxID=433724 RepID=S0DG36_9ZZZZ